MKTNETIKAIMGRRSIRKYKPTPVDNETIETILRAGASAPSASNRQPWEFIVITKKEMREKLAEAHPYAKMLLQSPVCIIVCGNRERFYPEKEVQDYWAQDGAAVTENMLVAANSLGLGTVWCGVFPRKERVQAVTNVLKLPSDIIPLNLIALGHPDEDPPVKDKWRDERVHREGW
jgi:nitroreductase